MRLLLTNRVNDLTAENSSVAKFIVAARKRVAPYGKRPSWVIGDPELLKEGLPEKLEDDGATVRIPADIPEKLWAIRDDYPPGSLGEGEPGGAVFTVLFPDEY